MERVRDFFRKGIINPFTLLASATLGALTILGFLVVPSILTPVADMRIEPQHGVVKENDTFKVSIIVESATPVNVFAGELHFDPRILEVTGINYNTSIADLWAEEPWYSNGEGTLKFIGGTTMKGGFFGTGSLVTITYRTKQVGEGVLSIREATILQHDGLGTEAILEEPLDALFTIEAREQNVLTTNNTAATYKVVEEPPSTDVNDDGKQTLADISIFMLNIVGNDERFDFNLDGEVDTKDLSILLDAE